MRRFGIQLLAAATLSVLVACAGTTSTLPAAHAAPDAARVRRPRGSALTIPYFESSFSYAGSIYSYRMVGTDPAGPAATTTVPAAIVPVRFVFSDGTTLDGTSVAGAIPRSPLFTNARFAAGTTQYGDALMRAQFWKYAAKKNYHVLLATPTVEPTVQVSVPSADGYTVQNNGNTRGLVTFDWFVQTEEMQIISQLGIRPTTLTIFATADTMVLEPSGYCCYRGYHQAFPVATSSGTQIWTTAWASLTRKGMKPLSHEIAEWLSDPFYDNAVASWISPESGACGGSLLEVGDPVTKYSVKADGYLMQDETFFSWFARQRPSIGIDGRYDLAAKLRSPATSCPT
ncbi:MAG TPA: hypothetical protein VNG31_05410 [Candidatus Baltobacteraceae bacterium]|nr:hypothetical protein [Candidatus Baltobacteraceae bacterium]